ncbi:MAG TPA: carbon storage regulator CsrA [Verrucomicrobiae bacterium]|nr:carbon storage regulator CsrA [Verrucomicrobiae bacterium]
MLVLSRKFNENIVIGDNIIVKVVRLEGDVVKLGIQAPACVSVHRQEVYDEIQRNNLSALTKGQQTVPRINRGKIEIKKDAPAS